MKKGDYMPVTISADEMAAADGGDWWRLAEVQMRSAETGMAAALRDMHVGPPRFWVGLWRRWVSIPFAHLRRWLFRG